MSKILELRDIFQANARSSEGAGTTTLTDVDARRQIFNLSAARTVKLPTTGIRAGDVFVMENGSASNFALTVQSSGANTIGILNPKTVLTLTALQDAPTAAGHWLITVSSPVLSIIKAHTPSGYGSGNTAVRYYTDNQILQGNAITFGGNSTDGSFFTINEAGLYSFSITDTTSAADAPIGISINSNQLSTNWYSLTEAHRIAGTDATGANERNALSAVWYCVPGDVIRHHGPGCTGTSTFESFIIAQIYRG